MKFAYKLLLIFLFYQLPISSESQSSNARDLNTFSYSNQVNNTTSTTNIAIALDYNYAENDNTAIEQNNPITDYPPAKRDFKRLGLNTALFVGSAVVAFGILWVLPDDVTNWDKEKMKQDGIFYKWEENVKAGPVVDEDNFFFNYVTHPWAGSVYYMTARSSGFKWYESFTYSFLMSTFFWEYGIEAFAEVPSVQDIFITPIIGSAMGEGCFYAKKTIFKHDKRILKSRILGITTLFLMDPYNTILDGVGYQSKKKTETGFVVLPVYNPQTKSAIWSANLTLRF